MADTAAEFAQRAVESIKENALVHEIVFVVCCKIILTTLLIYFGTKRSARQHIRQKRSAEEVFGKEDAEKRIVGQKQGTAFYATDIYAVSYYLYAVI